MPSSQDTFAVLVEKRHRSLHQHCRRYAAAAAGCVVDDDELGVASVCAAGGAVLGLGYQNNQNQLVVASKPTKYRNINYCYMDKSNNINSKMDR